MRWYQIYIGGLLLFTLISGIKSTAKDETASRTAVTAIITLFYVGSIAFALASGGFW